MAWYYVIVSIFILQLNSLFVYRPETSMASKTVWGNSHSCIIPLPVAFRHSKSPCRIRVYKDVFVCLGNDRVSFTGLSLMHQFKPDKVCGCYCINWLLFLEKLV